MAIWLLKLLTINVYIVCVYLLCARIYWRHEYMHRINIFETILIDFL